MARRPPPLFTPNNVYLTDIRNLCWDRNKAQRWPRHWKVRDKRVYRVTEVGNWLIITIPFWALLCIRQCAVNFARIITIVIVRTQYVPDTVLSSLYIFISIYLQYFESFQWLYEEGALTWGNWDTKRLSNISKVLQPGSGRGRISTQEVWLQLPCF